MTSIDTLTEDTSKTQQLHANTSTEALLGWAMGRYHGLRAESARVRDIERSRIPTSTTLSPRTRMGIAHDSFMAAEYMLKQIELMCHQHNGNESALREWLLRVVADNFDWRAEYYNAGN